MYVPARLVDDEQGAGGDALAWVQGAQLALPRLPTHGVRAQGAGARYGGEGGSTAPEVGGNVADAAQGWIDDGEWREIVSRYFPPQEVEKALRVSYCESHWMDKYDDSGAHVGRFQIAWRWHQSRFGHPDELLDPDTNARVAAAIWRDNNGWSPWPTCGKR